MTSDAEKDVIASCEAVDSNSSPTPTQPSPPSSAPLASILSAKQLRRYETGYFLSTFALGPPFASFGTYVGFQIQTIGYVVGRVPEAAPGTGCPPTATACRVPFAGSGDVNLTSYLIYLNAIIYAVSGLVTLVVAGVGDRLGRQRGQYIAQLILYGVLCLPIAALRGIDLNTFNALSGLYVVFNVVGFIAGAWMNIFVPFVMRESGGGALSQPPQGPDAGNGDDNNKGEDDDDELDCARRAIADGVRMSVWGANGLSVGQIVLLLVSLGLTYASSTYGGLYTTTGSGVLCIFVSLVAWRLLPTPEPTKGGVSKSSSSTTLTFREWLTLPLSTFGLLIRQVWAYPECFKLLAAYTVYTDASFALGAVTGQLLNLHVRPSLREFTLFTLAQPVAAITAVTIFLLWSPARRVARDRLGLTLRWWLALSYAVTGAVGVWCAIEGNRGGIQERWAFYVAQVLQSVAAGISGVAFRVLFARLFPRGEEVRFYGFQLVISLSTVWVPQIVAGPIVDATNNPRLPAAVSAALLFVSVGGTLLVNEEKGMRLVGYRSTGD